MVITKLARSLFSLMLLFCINGAWAAEFTASVDRQEIAQDEHIVLTLELFRSDTRLRAQGVDPNVDVTVLSKDFDLGTPRNKINYNVFTNQGRATSALEIELFPKTTGNFTIPSFTVDGMTTPPIAIRVMPSANADTPLVFSRGGVNTATPWQRQQLVVYHDTYYRVDLASAKLGGDITLEPRTLESYEHFRLPMSERSEQHNGFTYKVMRASWAVFPTDSGKLTIHLPEAWIVTRDEKKLRLPQETLNVDVKALPAGTSQDIMIGKPALTIEPVQSNTKAGEANTWRIRISAPSRFNALPNTLSLATPSDFSLFVDNKADDRENLPDGVTQIAYYAVSAIAQQTGRYQLPEVQLPYFDPQEGRVKSATLPGATFTVSEALSAMPTTTSAPSQSELPAVAQTTVNGWMIATLIFAALWLGTLGYVYTRNKQEKPLARVAETHATPTRNLSPRPLEAQLLVALNSRSLEEGLRDLLAQHGAQPFITDTLRQVQAHYYANSQSSDLTTLTNNVEHCCEAIRKLPSTHHPIDPWSPNAFTKSAR